MLPADSLCISGFFHYKLFVSGFFLSVVDFSSQSILGICAAV